MTGVLVGLAGFGTWGALLSRERFRVTVGAVVLGRFCADRCEIELPRRGTASLESSGRLRSCRVRRDPGLHSGVGGVPGYVCARPGGRPGGGRGCFISSGLGRLDMDAGPKVIPVSQVRLRSLQEGFSPGWSRNDGQDCRLRRHRRHHIR